MSKNQYSCGFLDKLIVYVGLNNLFSLKFIFCYLRSVHLYESHLDLERDLINAEFSYRYSPRRARRSGVTVFVKENR